MLKSQKRLAIVIIVIAIVLMRIMVVVNKKQSKQKPLNPVTAVRVEHVVASDIQAKIQATATIEANQTLNLSPEVSGKITWVSPKLRAGGVVRKGDLLVKIDDEDYKLALEQLRVAVNRAKLEIDQETARGEVAQKEWGVLGDEGKAPDLVLRVQQAEVARLNLRSAESALKKGELALKRTKLRAPFTAYVSQSSVAVGQYVSPQVVVARLLEKANLTAEVSVSLDELKWMDIPGIDGARKGSTVKIELPIGGGEKITREGEVKALIGEMDQTTRRARVRVSLADNKSGETPLLPGAFVDVTIFGKSISGAYKIPREALVDNKSIFIVDAEKRLKAVSVNRIWGTKQSIISKLNVEESGIDILTSHPQGAVTGLKVRPLSLDNFQEK